MRSFRKNKRKMELEGVSVEDDDDHSSRLVSLFYALLYDQAQRKNHPRWQLFHVTIIFFFGFSVTVLFSPTIATVGPLLNLTATQSSVLIALPTVTATIVRIPLSISTGHFGTRLPIVATALIGALGLLGVVFIIFFAPLSPSLFAAYLVFALIIGLAGSLFPVGFVHATFWTPKARQGLALSIYLGFGSLGTAVFSLILPFMIAGIGLGYTYVIWMGIQVSMFFYAWMALCDPPYLRLSRLIRHHGAKVDADWGQKSATPKAQATFALSAKCLQLALEAFNHVDTKKSEEEGEEEGKKNLPLSTFLLSSSEPFFLWRHLRVGAAELRALCLREHQDVVPRSFLLDNLKLSVRNWRVWCLFFLQLSTFGAGNMSLAIWGPTYFRVGFGLPNTLAGIITFCFGLCCSGRVFFGRVCDLYDNHWMGFFSSLAQGALLYGVAFPPSSSSSDSTTNSFFFSPLSLGVSISCLLMSGLVYGLANSCLFTLINTHEPRAPSGAVGIVSSGIIGGAIFSASYGPLVASYAPQDVAYATRLVVVIPATICCAFSFLFLLLKYLGGVGGQEGSISRSGDVSVSHKSTPPRHPFREPTLMTAKYN